MWGGQRKSPSLSLVSHNKLTLNLQLITVTTFHVTGTDVTIQIKQVAVLPSQHASHIRGGVELDAKNGKGDFVLIKHVKTNEAREGAAVRIGSARAVNTLELGGVVTVGSESGSRAIAQGQRRAKEG